jgi:hypothetical protein
MSQSPAPREAEPDTWQEDTVLFEARFRFYRNQPRLVWGDIQGRRERTMPWHLTPDLVPTSGPMKYCWDIAIQAYTLEPRMLLTVGLFDQPDDEGAIGRVIDDEQDGTIKRKVGWGQCWYYPESATFEIYEALLEEGGCNFRDAPLLDDPHMRALWLNIERVALARFPAIAQFSTPFADDGVAPTPVYQAFLRSVGYAPSPTAKAAFVKYPSS